MALKWRNQKKEIQKLALSLKGQEDIKSVFEYSADDDLLKIRTSVIIKRSTR